MNKPDISVIVPAYNEGESVKYFLSDLINSLTALNRGWEILFIDNNTSKNSEKALKALIKKYKNVHGYQISHPGVTTLDKANKYMLGFELAQGKYIIHMDADGQDRPEELSKFLKALDSGADLAVGYKQKRKDGLVYNVTSRIANGLVRFLTGVKVHDMNNGFKAYKAEVAKNLKLYGGDFRFIPIILTAKGKKIVEIPVEHRKRKYGEGKYTFMSRLKGGIVDLAKVIVSTKIAFISRKIYSNIPESYKSLIIKEY